MLSIKGLWRGCVNSAAGSRHYYSGLAEQAAAKHGTVGEGAADLQGRNKGESAAG